MFIKEGVINFEGDWDGAVYHYDYQQDFLKIRNFSSSYRYPLGQYISKRIVIFRNIDDKIVDIEIENFVKQYDKSYYDKYISNKEIANRLVGLYQEILAGEVIKERLWGWTMFTEYRKTTTYYGDDGNIVDTDDESEADKVVNDDTNDNDVVEILVDNYLIHELDEANAIWGEDKLQSVPNKRNKYYLVISNENNVNDRHL